MNTILDVIVKFVMAVISNRAISALFAWLIGIATAVFSTFLSDEIRVLDLHTPERAAATYAADLHKRIEADFADLKSSADDSLLGKLVESGNDERIYPDTFAQAILVGDGTKISVADRLAYHAHMNSHMLHTKDAEETIVTAFSHYVESVNGKPADPAPYFRNLLNATGYNFDCLESLWKMRLEPATGIQYKELRCHAPRIWDHKNRDNMFYILSKNTTGLDRCIPTLREYVQAVAAELERKSRDRALAAGAAADKVDPLALSSIASRFGPKPNQGAEKFALQIDPKRVTALETDCATPKVYKEDSEELAGSFPPPDAVPAYGNKLPGLEPAKIPELNLGPLALATDKADNMPNFWERLIHRLFGRPAH
jgi:hypothetical protein